MEANKEVAKKTNCRDYGGVNGDDFGHYTPLVGKYVALASLACAICIALDLFRSIRWRKPWIAAKFFPLNAATLTILAVAIKIPTDTSEVMPGLFDQLAKLSGVVLVCISMNHMMPSLGVMSDITIFSNMIALGILVVTLFINILFQCATGLITQFRGTTLMVSAFMLFVFSIFSSHALTVTTVKKLLAKQYNSKHQDIQSEIQTQGYLTNKVFPVDSLKDYVNKYWLLARTSSPDYTLRGSGIAYVSALVAYGLVGVGFITHIISRLFSQWREKTKGCYVRSGYKRSAGYIFWIQAVAILLGAIASLLRTISSEPTPEFVSVGSMLQIEVYRIQKLRDWREAPVPFHVKSRIRKKLTYKIMNLILLCLIGLQRLIIVLAKVVLLLNALVGYLICFPLYCCCICIKEKETTNEESHTTVVVTEELDLKSLIPYVLHVEGVPLSNQKTLKLWIDQTQTWIKTGQSSQPTTMIEFLDQFSTPSQSFPAIADIYTKKVEGETDDQKLPNCWSLTIVTLATVICVSFRNIRQDELTRIMKAADEGFRYARFVDKNFPVEGSRRMINAAKMVWDTVDLFNNWMNEDLQAVLDKGDSLAIIRELQRIASDYLDKAGDDTKSWPIKATAANCLYKKALADAMGACLISLPRAILSHCSSGTFGAREERVRKAAVILGETEAILKWLADPERMCQYPTSGAQYIDNWYS